jgi:hypothetical protein
MIRKPHIRRPVTIVLMLAGAGLMFLASETLAGALVFAFGLLIEAAGVAYKDTE